MISFIHFIGFYLISVRTESVYGSTHAVIGDYSQLNPNDCGINSVIDGFDDNCFKWHKSPLPNLKAGINAEVGEVPWMAAVIFTHYSSKHIRDEHGNIVGTQNISTPIICSGSLIAEEWVITAAHCLHKNTTLSQYQVFFGETTIGDNKTYNSSVIEIHVHPSYEEPPAGRVSRHFWMLGDLALFKIKNPFVPSVRSICLPEPHILNEERELALNAGWGPDNTSLTFERPLQMGYKMIDSREETKQTKDKFETILTSNGYVFESLPFDEYFKNFIVVQRIDNQTLTCKGDSGGPIWQFAYGRAVLVGTVSFFLTPQGLNLLCDDLAQVGGMPWITRMTWLIRISSHIDWIKNITQIN